MSQPLPDILPLQKTTSGKHYCCICQSGFDAFAPFGLRQRPNVSCPSCGSAERHRLIYDFLFQKTSFFRENLRVCHFAPEPCLFKQFRSLSNLHYVTVDIQTRRNTMVQCAVEHLPFAGKSFDAIISVHVLEHVRRDFAAMKEMFRILKPGGWGIIQVPSREMPHTLEDASLSAKERSKVYGNPDHVRLYSPKDFIRRLRRAGFCVQALQPAAHMSDAELSRRGLVKEMIIFYCRRPKQGLFSRTLRKLLSFVFRAPRQVPPGSHPAPLL